MMVLSLSVCVAANGFLLLARYACWMGNISIRVMNMEEMSKLLFG